MTRRLKAAIVALFMAVALIAGARVVAADDWEALRIVCAPWRGWPIVWDLLGCWQLPDPPPPMT